MTSQNPLRIRMVEEMRIRNLSCETQRNYIHHVAEFARHSLVSYKMSLKGRLILTQDEPEEEWKRHAGYC